MENFDRNRSLGHLINWAARLFRNDVRRRLQAIGLLPGHIPVLMALGKGVELSQTELSKWSQIEQPAMAALLVRMEKMQLICRSTDPKDGRVSLFKLTPLAAGKLPAFYEALNAGNALATTTMSDTDREQAIVAIHLIISNFGGVEGLNSLNETRVLGPNDENDQ